jgi:hypothetical protein
MGFVSPIGIGRDAFWKFAARGGERRSSDLSFDVSDSRRADAADVPDFDWQQNLTSKIENTCHEPCRFYWPPFEKHSATQI